MFRLPKTICTIAASAFLMCFANLQAARAHGDLPPIEFWGSFDAATAECQRILSTAGQRCFDRVLGIERRCMDGQLAGQPCADATREARIASAKQNAQNELATACSEMQLQQLHFANLEEAQSDLARTCGDQADAAMSVMYGPAMARGSAAGAAATMRSCLAQTANLTSKLLRLAVDLKSRALDRMAVNALSLEQKQALMARVLARVARARTRIQTLIGQACPGFNGIYDRDLSGFLDAATPRSDCVVGAGYVQSAVTCPVAVCGNGVKDPGEQCDDGNTVDDDLCHNDCTRNPCTVFPSSFALIQTAIFENHRCTDETCHGSARQGGLDLRAGVSYADTVGVASEITPTLRRIEPGDESRSLLWLKLAASTLGKTGVAGSPMPLGFAPLSANELEAVRLWIHAAAPQAGNVLGVAELLDACAVPADPIQIDPLPPPAPGTGVQLHMPRWTLPAHSENEVCFVSYYDLTDQVPPQFRGANGQTFRFHSQNIVQDPQSHHLIVNLYQGTSSIDDPAWGAFTCKGGSLDGQSCNPKQANACGSDGLCGSEPTRSVACIGFGPADAQTNSFSGFTGTQQTAYEQTFFDGVYEEVPLKGIIIWNSHAFNLTRATAKQEAWLNFEFAAQSDQKYPVHGIFDIDHIFDMVVPPFQTQEVCAPYVLEKGTRLFQLSSHNHKRGKRFDIFLPDGSLIFTSTIYNDPLQLNIDPPLAFDDPDPAKRALRYCALYDNGSSDPSEVKMKSTSPPTPNGFPFGGPCSTPSGCTQGKIGQTCVGSTQAKRNAACDSNPNAGDGFCDACTLRGGVTTEDEMLILLGAYYKVP